MDSNSPIHIYVVTPLMNIRLYLKEANKTIFAIKLQYKQDFSMPDVHECYLLGKDYDKYPSPTQLL